MAEKLQVCAAPGCGVKFPPYKRGSDKEYCTRKCQNRASAGRAYQNPKTLTDALRKTATSPEWKSPEKGGKFRFHDCACGAVYVLEFRWNVKYGPQFRMLKDGRGPRSEDEKKQRWTNIRVPTGNENISRARIESHRGAGK